MNAKYLIFHTSELAAKVRKKHTDDHPVEYLRR